MMTAVVRRGSWWSGDGLVTLTLASPSADLHRCSGTKCSPSRNSWPVSRVERQSVPIEFALSSVGNIDRLVDRDRVIGRR